MNNNTTMVVGGIIVLLLVGGLIFYGMNNTNSPSNNATTTPTTSVPDSSGTVTTTTTTTTAAAPTVMTSASAVVSNSVAVVTGRVTPNGAQTSYWYEYGRTNTLGARTVVQGVGSGYISIAAPSIINGLTANTLYYYRLSAQNVNGTTVGQVYTFTTNTNPPLQGIGPTTRTDPASLITRTSANLNGQITPNSSDTSYWFEWGETSELGNTTALQSAGNGTVTKPVSAGLSNLKPITKYYFRLNAQNQFGTMTGGTNNFTTTGPVTSGSPTVVTTGAGAVATSSATLRGHLNPNSYPTTYWFEYGTDSLLGNILGSSARTELAESTTVTVSVSADIRGLNTNSKYYYQLIASNVYGTVHGDIMSFTTKH